jgi:hypothetical protein
MRITRNRLAVDWMPPGVFLVGKGYFLRRRTGGPLLLAAPGVSRAHVWQAYSDATAEYFARESFREARKRCAKSGRNYEISPEQEARIIARASGRCELTGIRFNMSTHGARRAPFAPSLDRIRSSEGYTARNVRLVCVAVNLAMNEWGESVFKAMAAAYVEANSDKTEPEYSAQYSANDES